MKARWVERLCLLFRDGLGVLLLALAMAPGCNDAGSRTLAVTSSCVSCHAADRATATEPDHIASGFSDRCDTCHSETSWKPASFDHSGFPLLGRHAELSCAECHGDFTGAGEHPPTTCIGCHDADRSRPTTPDHLSPDFPTTCDTCHSVLAWKPAALDHSKFPLTGKHATISCESCHATDPVPTTCIGCHEADRASVTLPDHTQAGFSTDCTACHTTTAWTPASFDHLQYFPLSGRHDVSCGTCHINLQDATQVSCMEGACHPQAETNAQHNEVTNYSYTTAGCLHCHPTGSSD